VPDPGRRSDDHRGRTIEQAGRFGQRTPVNDIKSARVAVTARAAVKGSTSDHVHGSALPV
jgi:hypothetical protein